MNDVNTVTYTCIIFKCVFNMLGMIESLFNALIIYSSERSDEIKNSKKSNGI